MDESIRKIDDLIFFAGCSQVSIIEKIPFHITVNGSEKGKYPDIKFPFVD
jgi:hypothetical protein